LAYIEQTREEKRTIKQYKMAVNVTLILSGLAAGGYVLYTAIYSALYNTEDKSVQTQMVSGYTLAVVGILFLVTGISINIKLKRYFPEFYLEHRLVLWIATIGLSIPIMIRASFDILRNIDPALEHWIVYHGALYSPLFYIFGDLLPITL
jgi:hypothetical protein